MAEFLHKKSASSPWYYRRRYPADVAKVLDKATYMQSLKTTVKREAERLSRGVSVQFDAICHEARLMRDLAVAGAVLPESAGVAESLAFACPDEVLSRIPVLVRQAASRVIEEQQRNPRGWLNVVKGWQAFYEAMKVGHVPSEAQRPAIEAQAILNGIELAIQGKPLPAETVTADTRNEAPSVTGAGESWTSLCRRALAIYRDRVIDSRYRLAQRRLPDVKVVSVALNHVEVGLVEWCRGRLKEVAPRTVKTQLDCMVSALRCALPKLQSPRLRELQGVMQPRTDDRQSMPVQAMREALLAVKDRPTSTKVRKDYGGGASQFDAIAFEVLAVLGLRPSELVQATAKALVTKVDVFGKTGLYFRIAEGKNKASERDIPLSDGERSILDVDALRRLLAWQEENPRDSASARTSLGTRFKDMTGGYTLYQMRHAWKDIAVHAGIDFELRERLLGHRVRGVAAVYGSGIPLEKGLEALSLIRRAIFSEKR